MKIRHKYDNRAHFNKINIYFHHQFSHASLWYLHSKAGINTQNAIGCVLVE